MPFPDRQRPVVLVESSQSVRSAISKGLKERGFPLVQTFGALEDALRYLETDGAAWMIAPSGMDGPVNLLQMLKLAIGAPTLQDLRISALVNEADDKWLTYGFELGLISYFTSPVTPETFNSELDVLLKTAEDAQGNDCKIAFKYLGDFFRTRSRLTELVDIERLLCRIFPADSTRLVALAEALFSSGDKSGGEGVLAQIMMLDESKTTDVHALSDRYLEGTRRFGGGGNGSGDLFGLKKVIIVDNDDSSCRAISTALLEVGAIEASSFSNADEAIEYISNSNCDDFGLVVQEWRLPKVPGYLLIQKLRAAGLKDASIFVHSSLVRDDDKPLLIEFGATDVIAKPFSKQSFVRRLAQAVQRDRDGNDAVAVEAKVRRFLEAGKLADAERVYDAAKAKGVLSAPLDALCAAGIAFAKNDFVAAVRLATASIKARSHATVAYNLLGKALMAIKQYEAAAKCYERANTLSPKNLERLCLLAEAYRESGDEDKADATLAEARKIDSNSDKVQKETFEAALKTEDVGKIVAAAAHLTSQDQVIALTNNRAVALVKSGKIEDAMKLYQSILGMLPAPDKMKLVPVNYNIALACVRNGALDPSLPHLEAAICNAAAKQEQIVKKAQSLKRRIEHSLKTGEPIKLNYEEGVEAATQDTGGKPVEEGSAANANAQLATEALAENAAIAEATLVIQRAAGDLGCYLAYTTANWPPEVQALIESLPHFVQRSAVKREEALGLERMIRN